MHVHSAGVGEKGAYSFVAAHRKKHKELNTHAHTHTHTHKHTHTCNQSQRERVKRSGKETYKLQ